MRPTTPFNPPSNKMSIQVQIINGDRGLVWDVEDILKLRKEFRLIGSMVGGIAGFQSQVAVMGLPMQLSPEEVALAAAAGWIHLHELSFDIPTASAAADAAAAAANAASRQQQAASNAATTQQQQQQQQGQPIVQSQQHHQQHDPMQLDDCEEYDEFYAAYYGLEAPQQQPQPQQLAQQQQQPTLQQQQQQPAPQKQQQVQQEPHPWQLALKQSSKFAVPLTVADAVAAVQPFSKDGGAAAEAGNDDSSCGQHKSEQQEQQGGGVSSLPASNSTSLSPYCRSQPAQWQHPHTALQWLRLAVFADLHSKGFCVTGGAKFGGDFLAYPGDPHLYHAQYVVRVLLPDQVLYPSVLQGLARGVHAARKHLVLATAQPSAAGGVVAAESTAAAVGGLRVAGGVGGSNAETAAAEEEEQDGDAIVSAAAAVAAAATDAACAGLFQGVVRTGPVFISSEGAVSNGVLRYITIARETGWSGE